MAGAGLHLFWRDPGIGMAGLALSRVGFTEGPDAQLDRIGLERELYLGDWTLAVHVGEQSVDVPTQTFAGARVNYYVTDDLRVDFGVEGADEVYARRAGLEWRFAPASSARIGAIDVDGDTTFTLGLEITFGGSGTGLKGRDRQDDPVNGLFETLVTQARGLRAIEAQKAAAKCQTLDGFYEIDGQRYTDPTICNGQFSSAPEGGGGFVGETYTRTPEVYDGLTVFRLTLESRGDSGAN